MKEIKIAIVDPYISTNFFVQSASQNNISCIALLRDSAMADSMQQSGRFDSSVFLRVSI